MTEELKRWVPIMFPMGLKGKVNLTIREDQLRSAQEAKDLIDASEEHWNDNPSRSDSN